MKQDAYVGSRIGNVLQVSGNALRLALTIVSYQIILGWSGNNVVIMKKL
jgi:hypothetical protein